jgi:hypothetical protein
MIVDIVSVVYRMTSTTTDVPVISAYRQGRAGNAVVIRDGVKKQGRKKRRVAIG